MIKLESQISSTNWYPVSLIGTETLSELFAYWIIAFWCGDSSTLAIALQQSYQLSIQVPGQVPRRILGILTAIESVHRSDLGLTLRDGASHFRRANSLTGENYPCYRLQLRPPQYRLITKPNNRTIFNTDLITLTKQYCERLALELPQWRITPSSHLNRRQKMTTAGSNPNEKRAYSVQYQETDWHFLSRMWQIYGVYHRHCPQNNQWQFFNDLTAVPESLPAKLTFLPGAESSDIQDYSEHRCSTLQGIVSHVCFDSHAVTLGVGEQIILHGLEQLESENLITAITHYAQDWTAFAPQLNKLPTYHNSVTIIPKGALFYPQTIYQWPQIWGHAIGTVVGGAPGSVVTDASKTAVKVHCEWDMTRLAHESSTPWVSVLMRTAGKNSGHYALPRVGDAVILNYLNHDPEQPIIVGSVLCAAPSFKSIAEESWQQGINLFSDSTINAGVASSWQWSLNANNNSQNKVISLGDTLIKSTANYTEITKKSLQFHYRQGIHAQVLMGSYHVTSQQGDCLFTIPQGEFQILAGQGITLQVGSSFLRISQDGLQARSPQILLESLAS